MKILAFDTTNLKPSIALLEDSEIVDLIVIEQDKKPAELLIPKIEEILATNNISYQDLDAIGFSRGPASFTTVRIGLSVVKSLSLVLDIPFFGFDSLSLIASKYSDFEGKIFVVMDARMDEFFVAEFFVEDQNMKIIKESQLVSSGYLENLEFEDNILICGSGKEYLSKILSQKDINYELTNEDDEFSADILSFLASDRLVLGEEGDSDFDPLYLRDPKIGVRKG